MHSLYAPLFIAFFHFSCAGGLAGGGAASLSAKSQSHSYATISTRAIEIHSARSNLSLGTKLPLGEKQEVSIDEAAAAAVAAASTVAKVATALGEANLPDNVREAALEAASAAAARAALQNKGMAAEDHVLTTSVAATWGQQNAQGSLATNDGASTESAEGRRYTKEDKATRDSEVPSQAAPEDSHLSSSRQSPAKETKRIIDDDKLLYVGIFSSPQDFDRRDAARKGWLSLLRREFSDSAQVRAHFVIGRRPVKAVLGSKAGQLRAGTSLIALNRGDETSDGTPRIELDNPWATTAKPLISTTPPLVDPSEVHLDMQLGREFAEKGDMLHIPYEDLPIRVLMFFARAVETQYKYIMKVDVDWSFNFQPVIRALRDGSPDKLIYAGQKLSSTNTPAGAALDDDEDASTKANKMKYFEGPCYLTSHSLAQRIAKKHLDHSLMLWSYSADGSGVDDVDMGQWVAWEDQLVAKAGTPTAASNSLIRSESPPGADDASQAAKQQQPVAPAEKIEYRTMDLCESMAEMQPGD